jgi:hypothetical protein
MVILVCDNNDSDDDIRVFILREASDYATAPVFYSSQHNKPRCARKGLSQTQTELNVCSAASRVEERPAAHGDKSASSAGETRDLHRLLWRYESRIRC